MICQNDGSYHYLSDQGMEDKFGGEKRLDVESDFEFSVQRYLDYQGDKFIKRFDANSYLKLTEALDRFDLVGEKGLAENLKSVEANTLVISFSSDWLYTPEQNKRIATALPLRENQLLIFKLRTCMDTILFDRFGSLL